MGDNVTRVADNIVRLLDEADTHLWRALQTLERIADTEDRLRKLRIETIGLILDVHDCLSKALHGAELKK